MSKWAAGISVADMHISVVTILELEHGVLLMERKDTVQGSALRRWLESSVLPAFDGRILPVDTDVARECARLHVPDPRSERYALIAATARVHGLKVVTRNVSDFIATGVPLFNPWES